MFHQLNLNNQLDEIISIVRYFRPDYIVNFAAQGMVAESWDKPEQWFQTNCLAIMNFGHQLLGEEYLKRFVQISTPEVYGSCTGITEANAKLHPSTPYAASKACGDLSLYPFFVKKGFPLVITRATNVYGPHQQLYRIIPRTILYLLMGKKILLDGGGKAIKSYMHIRDVCDATMKITRSGRNGEVYHISPDNYGIRICDLVNMICKKMKKNYKKCIKMKANRDGQDAKYVISSNKLREAFGWKPTIELDEGIDEVISWIEENYKELIKTSMNYVHKP